MYCIAEGSKNRSDADALIEDWRVTFEVIRKCVDCYEYWTTSKNNKDYFTLLCTKPHLLVFVREAKENGTWMWPAKVLSVDNDKNVVAVEFFGVYLRGEYTFDECFLYSDAQEETACNLSLKF